VTILLLSSPGFSDVINRTVAPPTTSFCPEFSALGIIASTIRVMEFENFTVLTKVDFDATEAQI